MTEDAPWAIIFESRAERDLGHLDPPVARRMIAALDRLAAHDTSLDLRRLQDSDEWRIRVGGWRIRLRLAYEAHAIVVVRILPRGRVYDR